MTESQTVPRIEYECRSCGTSKHYIVGDDPPDRFEAICLSCYSGDGPAPERDFHRV